MKLTNLGLHAFYVTAKLEHMSKAAEELGLTQSALSQRIMKLEDELEATLFIRESKKITLTEVGEKLYRYCLNQKTLEDELLFSLRGDEKNLAGVLKIAAYSSILRSLIIPRLTPLLRNYPEVDFQFKSYEMNELPEVLKSGEADLIFMDYVWNKEGINQFSMGLEEFVLIESKKTKNENIYLDHGPDDNATVSFFNHQGKLPPKFKRRYMGDVYGIIDGVKAGLGRAIMSKHLIEDDRDIKILSGYKKYQRPIKAYYFEQNYYSKLFQKTLEYLS